jgi:hypothetical protein
MSQCIVFGVQLDVKRPQHLVLARQVERLDGGVDGLGRWIGEALPVPRWQCACWW